MGLLQLVPEQASTVAGQVDALYYFLIGVSVFFSLLIAGLVIYFAVNLMVDLLYSWIDPRIKF